MVITEWFKGNVETLDTPLLGARGRRLTAPHVFIKTDERWEAAVLRMGDKTSVWTFLKLFDSDFSLLAAAGVHIDPTLCSRLLELCQSAENSPTSTTAAAGDRRSSVSDSCFVGPSRFQFQQNCAAV